VIYDQLVTIQTLLYKVCYGFQHILAIWCIHWSYPLYYRINKCGPKWAFIKVIFLYIVLS